MCFRTASICTEDNNFNGSGVNQFEVSAVRRKRSDNNEIETTNTRKSKKNETEKSETNEKEQETTRARNKQIEPDNPLEMIFNPAKLGHREALLEEAKKEYRNNYGNMDMKKGYRSLFEILWYT